MTSKPSKTSPFPYPGEPDAAVADYLDSLIARTGLEIEYDLLYQEPEPASSAADSSVDSTAQSSDDPTASAPATPPASSASAESSITPSITVEFTGPDTPLLLARNGELLHAIEHIAAKLLHLEPEAHDRISFDAEGFKAGRTTELTRAAELAIQTVRTTGRPWSFAPMTSRERRMLHLIFSASGLPTASSGMGPRRFVVLYPEGFTIPPEADPGSSLRQPRSAPSSAERTEAIRNRFRRR
jgi:spoIIIJ-associated protein